MRTIKEIIALKDDYKNRVYSKTREEQTTDMQYRDDTFPVEEVRKPHKVLRLGIGARMVDAPAEQIVTSNPQVYFELKNQDISKKLSRVVNKEWIPRISLQNPNPFKESLKNKLCRGESFIRLVSNPLWLKEKPDKKGLPVLFRMLDPMVIYASPKEDDSGWEPDQGIPNNVIVLYERSPWDVISSYPEWSNPLMSRWEGKKTVTWIEYWDKEMRYFEADGEQVLTEEQQVNPYGFVPFIRKFSGFGRLSPDGDMSNLIVSDLRWNRDLIKELCIIESDIASRTHLMAHKPMTVLTPGQVNEEDLKDFSIAAYDLNILQNIPAGTTFPDLGLKPPTAEEFQHAADIYSKLIQRNPFLLAGFPSGVGGRQQDMTDSSARRRYDAPLENTELEFATAIKMALKICQVIPELRPDGISEGDLSVDFGCSVILRAKDPIEEDRLMTAGDRFYAAGTLSLRRNLIEYRGLTEDDAEDEIAEILVEKLTLGNPDVAAVMGMVFAEESGMADYIKKAQERNQVMGQQQGLAKPPTPTDQLRIQGEAQPAQQAEMGTYPSRGSRKPPVGY